MILGAVDFATRVLSDAFASDHSPRHELTDEQWARVEPHIPPSRSGPGRPGRPPRSPRQLLDGMLWILRTGAPWRDLPARYGPWRTVHHRFSAWRQAGVFDRLVQALQTQLVATGQIDRDLWCVDGTNVRAARCAAGARKKGAQRTSRRTMRWGTRAEASERSCTS